MKHVCDIIICVWNQKQVTQDCVESIIKNTKYPYRLVIIDNASEQETRDYLENLKSDARLDVHVIRNEENVGNTKAVNQGMAASDSLYVCNLDNDTYVTDGWLAEMVRVAESDPKIGLVAPGFPQKNPSEDERTFAWVEAQAEIMKEQRGKTFELVTVDCFCALIKREVIQRVGMWDEIYSPGYFDDTDYCRRVGSAGYTLVRARGAFVYHRESRSFKKKSARREELFNRNKKIYYERYGMPQRILYVVDDGRSQVLEKIKQQSYAQAKQANRIWFLVPKSLSPLSLNLRGQMEQWRVPDILFPAQSIFKILTRKKKFHQVYVTNSFVWWILQQLRFIHQAEVIQVSG